MIGDIVGEFFSYLFVVSTLVFVGCYIWQAVNKVRKVISAADRVLTRMDQEGAKFKEGDRQ